jgi:hypothetical protein
MRQSIIMLQANTLTTQNLRISGNSQVSRQNRVAPVTRAFAQPKMSLNSTNSLTFSTRKSQGLSMGTNKIT